MHEVDCTAAEKRFLKLLSDVDVVSFDVFGTLLQRSCSRPNFVFDLAFARWSGLPLERNGAFAAVRAAADDPCKYGRPMTLAEIYSNLPVLTADERSEIMEIEVDCERRLLFARPEVRELFHEAVARGKRIVVASDMYLSSETIRNLLEMNGYEGIERVFVSCELGCEKSDGRMLSAIAREAGVDSRRILHVGDSLRADVQGAVRSGARWVYVGPVSVASARGARRSNRLLGFGNELLPLVARRCEGMSPSYELGYCALGPLMLGFCQWLNHEMGDNDSSESFFLARDAKFILESYRMLYPSASATTHYLRVSRRTLNCVALETCKTLADVRKAVSFPRVMNARIFCSVAGISFEDDLVPAMDDSDFVSADERFDRDAFFSDSRITRSSGAILSAIRRRAKIMRSRLDAYARQEGLVSGCFLVDVGWHGSAQRALETVVHGRLRGRYFGTTKTEDLDSKGYIYDDLTADAESLMAGYWGLFESLFASGDGITTGYEVHDSSVVPTIGVSELFDDSLSLIQAAQDGAKHFLVDSKKIGLEQLAPMDCSDAFSDIHRYGTCPTSRLVKLFGDLEFLDFGETRHLVESHRRTDYLKRPLDLYDDFFASTWRIGFMKSVIPAPVDYGSIHANLRRLFNAVGRS